MQLPCYIKSYAAGLLSFHAAQRQTQTCFETATPNTTNKSAVYPCIGLNTACLHSVNAGQQLLDNSKPKQGL